MLKGRTFLSLVAGGIAAPRFSSAQQAPRKVALYANVGADLTHYDVDVAGTALIKHSTVTLPASVQYAIFTLRPAAALPVTARPEPSIMSPRFASIRRAARSHGTVSRYACRRAPST